MNAQELLQRYNAGERDFSNVDLHGVDLREAMLRGIVLRGANLERPRNFFKEGWNVTGFIARRDENGKRWWFGHCLRL